MKVLLTGGAGFIGSHLLRAFAETTQIKSITVVDNLITGNIRNIEGVLNHPKVHFTEGDIRDFDLCRKLAKGADVVCHQAALGSVPRSIDDPIHTNSHNVDGTLNIFIAAREAGIKRVVYASSSSVYGDDTTFPKQEEHTGQPLSPYAVTKKTNELYAKNFGDLFGMEMIGLRYFNIFGQRQSPMGPYAAVIPLFLEAVKNNRPATINGDGSFSRDFTYVDNAVEANKLALFTENPAAVNEVYNIACGKNTTLNELWEMMNLFSEKDISPEYGPERAGDVPHSLADISKAKELLGYEVKISIREGLKRLIELS